MIRQNFGEQAPEPRKKLPEELSVANQDLVNKFGILMRSLGEIGEMEHKDPWPAVDVKKAIVDIIEVMERRAKLFAELGRPDLMILDKTRIMKLQKVSQALDETMPVDSSILDLVKAIF